jgi:hypothetical protein
MAPQDERGAFSESRPFGLTLAPSFVSANITIRGSLDAFLVLNVKNEKKLSLSKKDCYNIHLNRKHELCRRKRQIEKRRNETAVKPLKTNDPAK